ncbi:LCP family protein [Actinocrinis puniceicyclus]|uniref:LCP family protein n=1 Tax=Actinocrinis puniceicyclus TaxID=977794 RepID=A0A8J7WQE0_9ACTN|nr:LCP family protein [Actinocrinis puniceicyclus]MBS2963615.1 LCP family protein [Actinocrinis puniceicyclus]
MASALVLAAAAGGWYLHSSVFGGLASSHALAGLNSQPHAGADLNILLMGLDSRRDNQGNDLPPAVLAQLHAGSSSDVGGYNTNTLILLHVPADGSRAVALSIPRDDFVDLPEGLGQHKIKEAYGRAKANAQAVAQADGTSDRATLERLGREAGRHAAIDAVQRLLGVTVDHFAEVNLAGFYDLADALGGVPVCLREPVNDRYSGAHFPAGVQTLDGAQSLAFVRQRHGLANGDLDRTHRQQAFLASAVNKLKRAGVFGDMSRIGALLDVARRDVVVDSGFDLLSFIHRAGAVTSGDVTFYTLPITGYATEDGESVNLIDPAQVRAVAQRLLSGQGPDASGTAAPPPPGGPAIPQAAAETAAGVAAGGPAAPATASATEAPAATAAASATPSASALHDPVRRGKAVPKNAVRADTASPASVSAIAAPATTAPTTAAPVVTAPPGIPCVN